MSIIKQPILYVGSRGEQHLYSLFDSGANLSCINPEFVGKLEIAQKLPTKRRMATACEEAYVEVHEVVRLEFYINDIMLSDDFLLVPGLTEEVVIGAATMQKFRIKLDFEHDSIHVDPKVAIMQVKYYNVLPPDAD